GAGRTTLWRPRFDRPFGYFCCCLSTRPRGGTLDRALDHRQTGLIWPEPGLAGWNPVGDACWFFYYGRAHVPAFSHCFSWYAAYCLAGFGHALVWARRCHPHLHRLYRLLSNCLCWCPTRYTHLG